MTRAMGIVADAVAAVIAEQALTMLGDRITTGEASALARRAVHAVRREGWHISALHPDGHDATGPDTEQDPRLRSYDPTILAGLARGDRFGDIGRVLRVPTETIRTRTLRLRQRIGARSAAHLVAIAYEMGWLDGLRPEPRPEATLTERQRIALTCAAQGLTNPEISARLGIGISAVCTDLARAYALLGARDRAHAVALGIQHGHLTVLRAVSPAA
ncbi:LuxR family transcriptional regulator [Streptomyces sp. ICN441]|uniref:response regulator transcription factor n=1 Tax=Streptomyces sp. ICN441 TaxID=2558286 RepID=UPI00106BCE0D|nr:helix-turn-helix transcriptional regulator [Streptomyces sp. ICN441]TFE42483.1 LuxR family transcriptional regulator [Streptomyces sp. ICN441]